MNLSDFLPFIIGVILTLIPTWRIVSRTGYHPALSILVAIPVIGPLVLLLILAFGDWPAKKSASEG